MRTFLVFEEQILFKTNYFRKCQGTSRVKFNQTKWGICQNNFFFLNKELDLKIKCIRLQYLCIGGETKNEQKLFLADKFSLCLINNCKFNLESKNCRLCVTNVWTIQATQISVVKNMFCFVNIVTKYNPQTELCMFYCISTMF